MVRQYVLENGQKRSLQKFAEISVAYLEQHPAIDEVVQLANNIVELKHDAKTAPSLIFPLPEGYEYNFSGFFGQVVGVGRAGIRLLHKPK